MEMHRVMPWSFKTKVVDETTIMICFIDGEGWEIYYKRPDFPFVFAFGLPSVHGTREVLEIAEANIASYADMFN